MNLLDETVGAENWQRRHRRDNANCIVSIYDEEKAQWVSKEDTGTESNTEKEKGLASDSFKRACVNWGIGRELYTAPRIKVYGDAKKLKYKHFEVKHIEYNDKREITSLIIVDETGAIVFSTDKQSQPKPTTYSKPAQNKKISEAQRKRIFAIAGKDNELLIREIVEKYGYETTSDITTDDYEKICNDLQTKIKTK